MTESYQEHIDKRIMQITKDYLEQVRNMVTKGDFGKALVGAMLGRTLAQLYRDRETRKSFGDLILDIHKLIEADFDDYASQNGLMVTEENKLSLMMQYSPHFKRLNEQARGAIQIMQSLEDHLNN
mgnify:CR=1 FL=1